MTEKRSDDDRDAQRRGWTQQGGASPDCCPPPADPDCSDPALCGPDCCAPPSASRRKQWLVFLVVMAMAAAVLVYGLVNRWTSAAQITAAVALPGAAGGPGSGASVTGQAFSAPGSDAAAALSVPDSAIAVLPTVARIASFLDIPVQSDVAFVLLPGDDQTRALAAEEVLSGAAEKLRAMGRAIVTRTMQKDADGHAELVEQFSISSFPCIVALGSGCRSATVTEITEPQLLRAFVVASQPMSGCTPGGACCPTPCR